jgi:predicted Na+-dependent transporter
VSDADPIGLRGTNRRYRRMLVALLLVGMATILGPRLIDVVFWLFAQDRWSQAFGGNMIWAVIGIILVPWTTLAFAIAQPFGNDVLTIVAVVIGVLADVATYGAGGYKSRSIYADNAS